MPESFATVEMIPDAVGTWMLHCHVNIHSTGGMNALFTVLAPKSKLSGAVKGINLLRSYLGAVHVRVCVENLDRVHESVILHL